MMSGHILLIGNFVVCKDSSMRHRIGVIDGFRFMGGIPDTTDTYIFTIALPDGQRLEKTQDEILRKLEMWEVLGYAQEGLNLELEQELERQLGG